MLIVNISGATHRFIIHLVIILTMKHYEAYSQIGNYRGLSYEIVNEEYIITGFQDGYETVDIPDANPFTRKNVNIMSIPDGTFANAPTLKYLTFPQSVTNLGSNLFLESPNLKSIYFRGRPPAYNEQTFSGISNIVIFYNTNQPGWTSIFAGFQTYPNSSEYSVQAEGDGKEYAIAGYSGSGGDVKIPIAINGLPAKRLKEFVFNGNTNLTSVQIPESVTKVGDLTFVDCINLTNIILPNSLTYMGNWNFLNSTKLKAIVLPNSLTSTGTKLFQGCSSLTNIVFGSGLTNIAAEMFSRCASLKEVEIPGTVKRIESGAFTNCPSLERIIFHEGLQSIETSFSECTNIRSIVLPNTLTNLSLSAFYGCRAATNIVVGQGLASIPWLAFGACSSAKEVIIGDSVTSIGDSAFSGCSALTNIMLGINVKSIGMSAFYGCSSLEVLRLPPSLEAIGNGAFLYGNKISKVTFPASFKTLGNTGLTEANFYFKGNPPQVAENFSHSKKIYYLPQMTAWLTNNLNGSQLMVWDLPRQDLVCNQNQNQISLQFGTLPDFVYTIQESNDFSQWSNVKTVIGNGLNVVETANIDSAPKKFFRIQRQ